MVDSCEVLVVFVVLGIVGVYEFSGTSQQERSREEVLQDALGRDAEGRERLKEVHEVAGGEPVVQREVSAEHLQPHEGDKRPLQIHEGGIPDGYYPIDLNTHSEDPAVQLCRLDTDSYHRDPSKIPMFKDLLRRSQCSGRHILTKKMSDLRAMDEVIKPTVFSESNPPATVALHCEHCSEAQQIEYLRTVVKAMGNSHRHRRLFFKFQSANTPMIDLYTKAFPEVPWIYVYRDPVEIIASHIKAGSSSHGAPCLRRRYDREIKSLLAAKGQSATVSANYCAAYLTLLNNGALQAFHGAGSRGLPVRYDDIPHVLMDKVFPQHFGWTPTDAVRSLMMDQAGKYSKDRKGNRQWDAMGDSEEKHKRASPEMVSAAETILGASFKELNEIRDTRLTKLSKVISNNQDHDIAKARRALDAAHHEEALMGVKEDTMLLAPAKVPPPGDYVPKGEPVLDRDGNYIPLAHRKGKAKYKGGPEGQGVYEETEKQYISYPHLVPLPQLLKRWPPDEPDIPDIPNIYHGSLEVFDYQNLTQRARADLLRYNEVPFKVYNVPNINEVVEKWKSDEYLINKFGSETQRVTSSDTNHFMYFKARRKADSPPGWKPPTGFAMMPFSEWLEKAKKADNQEVETPHYYLQLNSVGSKRWILDDITDFQPKRSFFVADPRGNRGINCRFGARGIIAEAHYDGGRNFVSLLRGAKRYILLPPSECKLLYLWPKKHPEGRHAKADWSKLDLDKYPDMAKAKATEVVVRAGEVLYIPSYWFHYIVSTSVTAQCNTRSGNAIRGREVLKDCGFYF